MKKEYQNRAKEILLHIKPQGSYKGFYYLETILEIATDNWNRENNLAKTYPIVAERHKCKPTSVERAIRALIWNLDYKKLSKKIGKEIYFPIT